MTPLPPQRATTWQKLATGRKRAVVKPHLLLQGNTAKKFYQWVQEHLYGSYQLPASVCSSELTW